MLGWHNRVMTEMLGYEPGELYGRDVNILYPDEASCREAGRQIKLVLESGANTPIEVQWKKKDGSLFDCRFRYAPFPYTDEQRAIITAADITESKRVEREIIASERRLKAILESSPDPIVVYDEKGHPTYINPAFSRVFGWSFSEVQGQTIPYVPDDQMDITLEMIKKLQEFGQSLGFETQRYNKAGERLDVLVNAASINDVNSEEVSSIVINLTDLTDQKRLKKRLLQAEKMELVGTLAGGIAHDFNNILTAINGFSELGERKACQGEATLREHQQVQLAAERARNLVLQLLTFSRQSEPVTQRLNLEQMVRDSLSMIERIIPKMIRVEFDADDKDKYFVNGDINQLNQIMINLCLNAADAMPDGGSIAIKIEHIRPENMYCSACHEIFSGNYICLQIKDTGFGMDKMTLQNLFVPFYTTKEVGKGTGLGLATVFGIVRSHAGHIVCRSRLGQGTTFNIFFPFVENHGSVIETQSESNDPPPLPAEETKNLGWTILVVDDEEVIREFVEESLAFYGFRVIPAACGEEALDIYKRLIDEIELVLLDISMPGMGGMKCLKGLLEINPEVKVVMSSGYFSDGLENNPLEQGASGFLNKPFRVEDLVGRIRSLLG
jgi:PAS domain S-box-containing protein